MTIDARDTNLKSAEVFGPFGSPVRVGGNAGIQMRVPI
jgi:hypothetical protein